MHREEISGLENCMLHFMNKIFTEKVLGDFCKPDLIIYCTYGPIRTSVSKDSSIGADGKGRE